MVQGASQTPFRWDGRRPANGPSRMMPATAVMMALDSRAASVAKTGKVSWVRAPSYLSSLPMNPRNGGKPAMDNAAAAAATVVIGMARARPPSRSTSRVPVSWSMIPMTRNKGGLCTGVDDQEGDCGGDASAPCSEPRNMVSVPSAITVV